MAEDSATVKVKANQHESYWSYTILALLLPVIGLILGIVFMAKDKKLDRKLGEHLLAISVLFMIVYGVAFFMWVAFNTPTSPSPVYFQN